MLLCGSLCSMSLPCYAMGWFVIMVFLGHTHLGDNCIQKYHLGRYIVGYTVGNLVLRRQASGAVKRDFRA